MAARTDLQQLVIPAQHQDLLRKIASAEERSMSAVVRVMIQKRAAELGLTATCEETEPEPVNA